MPSAAYAGAAGRSPLGPGADRRALYASAPSPGTAPRAITHRSLLPEPRPQFYPAHAGARRMAAVAPRSAASPGRAAPRRRRRRCKARARDPPGAGSTGSSSACGRSCAATQARRQPGRRRLRTGGMLGGSQAGARLIYNFNAPDRRDASHQLRGRPPRRRSRARRPRPAAAVRSRYGSPPSAARRSADTAAAAAPSPLFAEGGVYERPLPWQLRARRLSPGRGRRPAQPRPVRRRRR